MGPLSEHACHPTSAKKIDPTTLLSHWEPAKSMTEMGAQNSRQNPGVRHTRSANTRDRFPRRNSLSSGGRGWWSSSRRSTRCTSTSRSSSRWLGARGTSWTSSVFALGTEARGRSTVATGFFGTHTHHTVVNGSLDGVVLLVIHLREHVVLVEGGVTDVAHGGRLHDISYHKAFHRFILWNVLARKHADHTLHVSAILLVTSVVPPFLRHDSLLGPHVLCV